MTTLKITTVGDSAGIVLPKEVLARLCVDKGGTLYLVDTPGGIELTSYRLDFAEQMDLAESIMRENRDALRRLAK